MASKTAGKKSADARKSDRKKGNAAKVSAASDLVDDVPPPRSAAKARAATLGLRVLDAHSAPDPDRPASEAFRLPPGPVVLGGMDTVGTGYGPQTKEDGRLAMVDLDLRLAALQERLYAQGTAGDRRSVLLLLQGMDTSGKDGTTSRVLGPVNPLGLNLVSFKSPTAEELAHDFLWRIEKRVPGAGQIGVFNRSQYEDVLIVRVHDLVPKAIWSRRYAQINAFERRLARTGTTLVKCFLHISPQQQRARLLARLDDPEKLWKFNPADIDERGHWDEYQAAYADALRKCDTVTAPWYVIPADRKWYRNWAVSALLTEILGTLDPQFPPPDFDVAVQRARLSGQ
jgi:PPK2 family polyphosphate:nucleotide phosphotransferase